MDLIFYPNDTKINNGYNTVLTAVGINHRYAWCIPMKGKSATEANKAMKKLLQQAKDDSKEIFSIESDNGSEFMNKMVQDTFKIPDILHITANPGDHNFMGTIESFNKTIKAMIGKYCVANDTKKWIDVLPQLVKNYNNSEHSFIHEKPKDVTPTEEKAIIDDAIEKTQNIKNKKISIGDSVRIPNKKGLFEKQGKNYSDLIYVVHSVGISKVEVSRNSSVLKTKYNIDQLLLIPKDSKDLNQANIIEKDKQAKITRNIKKEHLTTWKSLAPKSSKRQPKSK